MDAGYQPQDEFLIEDPETLKVIADSLRLEILRALKEPGTVKDVAEQLEMPPTKLYYHVNLLEKHSLIRVVETNIVSGIIEKRYQISARHYRVEDSLLATTEGIEENLDHILGAMFNATQSEIKRSVQQGLMKLKKDAPCEQGILLKAAMRLTGEQLAAFCARLQALLDEVEGLGVQQKGAPADRGPAAGSPTGQGPAYGLSLAFYPLPTSEGKVDENSNE